MKDFCARAVRNNGAQYLRSDGSLTTHIHHKEGVIHLEELHGFFSQLEIFTYESHIC